MHVKSTQFNYKICTNSFHNMINYFVKASKNQISLEEWGSCNIVNGTKIFPLIDTMIYCSLIHTNRAISIIMKEVRRAVLYNGKKLVTLITYIVI